MTTHTSRPHQNNLVNIKETFSEQTRTTERQMTHACESCRKWQEHYYWHHMDVNKIRFFRIMAGDFAQGISIPEKFVSNFNGQIAEAVDLKVPSGETWHVGLTKIVDELFLMSGWEDFVKAHELQENDILLFTYCGNSSFKVLIFDANGCEKVSSLFSNKTSSTMRKHFDNITGKQAEHCSLSDSDDSGMPLEPVGFNHKASSSKKSSSKTKSRRESESPNCSNYDVKCDAIVQDESDDGHADSNRYYSRTASKLTDEEREEIFGLASIQPGNPAFAAVLQMSHVRRRNNFLVIPSRFAADHLEQRSHSIMLHSPNRKEKWCVKYYHTRYTRGFQGHPWLKFIRDNKLYEGYICVFELMKGERRATMTVHVIRKLDGRFVLVI